MAEHKVMFVCKANSTRSQMAEGWAKVLSEGRPFHITSSGLKKTAVNPKAVDFMAQVGLDISGQTSKALEEFSPEDFDVVISLCGCGTHLPPEWAFKGTEGKIFEDWNLTDPVGLPDDVYIQVRDRIKDRVSRLLDMLEGKVEVSASAKAFVAEELQDNNKRVVMFSRTTCPYCTKAKGLLQEKLGDKYLEKVHIIEVNLRNDEQNVLEAVQELVGRKSTPQIWIAGKHVGGCDDLFALAETVDIADLV